MYSMPNNPIQVLLQREIRTGGIRQGRKDTKLWLISKLDWERLKLSTVNGNAVNDEHLLWILLGEDQLEDTKLSGFSIDQYSSTKSILRFVMNHNPLECRPLGREQQSSSNRTRRKMEKIMKAEKRQPSPVIEVISKEEGTLVMVEEEEAMELEKDKVCSQPNLLLDDKDQTI